MVWQKVKKRQIDNDNSMSCEVFFAKLDFLRNHQLSQSDS